MKWREAVQTKYKKERRPNTSNNEIQAYKNKFSFPTSGRPVKKKNLDAAERDRQKQVWNDSFFKHQFFSEKFQLLLPQNLDDASSTHANDQLIALKNESQTENLLIMDLWRSTVNIRRKEIRNKTTKEMIDLYPGYSIPTLVSYIGAWKFESTLFST